jgi:hypothetical protein
MKDDLKLGPTGKFPLGKIGPNDEGELKMAVISDKKMDRSEKRLEIAISLLQGQLILKARDGYDPMGFKEKEIRAAVGGALDMAEELLTQNENFWKERKKL